jgi:hypothetical protein
MKILIHTVPYMMNATYFIDIGYANAFRSLGHSVYLLTYGDSLPEPDKFIPDVSISYFHVAYSQQTNYEKLAELKARYGTRIVIWGSPFDVPARAYTDEHEGLHPRRHVRWMESNLFDRCLSFYPPEGIHRYYRHWTDDFGIPVVSLPFAADTTVFNPCQVDSNFQADLCFIGGIHRTKQEPFEAYIRPLLGKYRLIAVGRGWEGWPVTQMKLLYGEESRVISSCTLSPNVHMTLSREVPGMPVNMRTFQAIAGGGCVVSDNVPSLRDYFSSDEIPIGEDPKDYEEKVDFLMTHPKERHQCWVKAYRRVLQEHTYVHRASALLRDLVESATSPRELETRGQRILMHPHFSTKEALEKAYESCC